MRQLEIITSPANPLLKDVRKAISRGALTDDGWCVAETFHLLEEALASDCRLRAVVSGESVRAEVEAVLEAVAGGRNSVRMAVVPDRLLDAASQGVVALVEPPVWRIEQMLGARQLVLVVDGVQDPGNLGTILRSAEAFGASGVILAKGSVSPFNTKAVRASSGSIFRVPLVLGMEPAQIVETLRVSGGRIYAAVPGGGTGAGAVDLTLPCAIVIGSEGRGVSAAWRGVATQISIPTAGVESLNAAISAAVLLYEARRQRSGHES